MPKNRALVISVIILAALILLQSTIFSTFSIMGARPDLFLLAFIFISHFGGEQKGMLLGFFLGLFKDFSSLSPLGFHAFSNTLLGYLLGKLRDKFFVDPFIVPVLLAIFVSLYKAFSIEILSRIFLEYSIEYWNTQTFYGELILNIVLAPFIFLLLKKTGIIKTSRDSFYD